MVKFINLIEKYKDMFKLKLNLKKSKFYRRHREEITYLLDLIRFVVEYGILLNIIFFAIIGFPITIINVVGLGFGWHFIRYEIPKLLKEYKKSWVS